MAACRARDLNPFPKEKCALDRFLSGCRYRIISCESSQEGQRKTQSQILGSYRVICAICNEPNGLSLLWIKYQLLQLNFSEFQVRGSRSRIILLFLADTFESSRFWGLQNLFRTVFRRTVHSCYMLLDCG